VTETDPTVEKLRTRLAEAAEVVADERQCPAPDTLWESARERLDRRTNEIVVMHIGVCGACAAAWRTARELASDDAPQKAGAVRSWAPMAVAASVLIVVLGGVAGLMLGPSSVGPAVYRTQEEVWLKSVLPEGETVSRDHFELRWTSGPEGTTYDIRVGTESLDVLARARGGEEPRFLVPAESLVGLPPGTGILWQVTAHLPDGRTIDSESFVTSVD
jgi:hypothetical protein